MRAGSAVERVLNLHVLPIEAPTMWVCSARTAKEEPPETRPVWSTRGNAAKCDGAGSTLTVELQMGSEMRIAGAIGAGV